MAKNDLTAERLRELLHYDPQTGDFTWHVERYKVRRGDIAGYKNTSGYLVIGVDRFLYRAHRLAWLYMTGTWPANDIDHKDGTKLNNAFDNLRDVTKSMNSQNTHKANNDSLCGLLGVGKQGPSWRAQIRVDGKNIRLGHFKTPELAHQAYLQVKRVLHEGCLI